MFKKVLKALGLFLVVILVVLVLLPVVFKKQIAEQVRNVLNENYNAEIDYADLSFSLLKQFPNPSVTLEKFVAVGKGEFDGDTLAAFKNIEVSFGWAGLLGGGNYHVQSISVIDPTVKLLVNKAGKANWDIVKDFAVSKDTLYIAKEGKRGFTIEVKNWEITNGFISYNNDTAKANVVLKSLNVVGSRSEMNQGFAIKSSVDIDRLSYSYKGFNYLDGLHIKCNQNYTYNVASSLYEFNENLLQLNALQLLVSGSIKSDTGKGPYLSVSVSSADKDVKKLLSIFPSIYDSSFTQIEVIGSAATTALIKGYYKDNQYPAINFHTEIKDGAFDRKGLPVTLKNVFINAAINKPQGIIDSTVVSISKFHIESGSDSINASVKITTPSSNANVEANVNGKIDIATLSSFFAGQDFAGMSGKASANLSVKAIQSDVISKTYKNIRAAGSLTINDLSYVVKGLCSPVKIKEANLIVHPEFITIDKLDMSVSKSQFSGSGKIENAIAYLMHAGELNTVLNIRSEELNLRDFIASPVAEKSVKNTSSSSASSIVVAKRENNDMSLTLNTTVKKLYYDKLVMQNVNGQVILRADTVSIKNLSASLLGGTAQLNSRYLNFKSDKPELDFHLNTSNISLQQLYVVIDNADKVAPSLKYISGVFSGGVTGTGKLKADKTINYNALVANGKIQITTLKIDELPTLTQIGKLAKAKSLDHLEARNVQSVFHFKNGQADFEPTDIKFTNGYRINFSGTHYPNQTVNADVGLDVPVKEFGSIANMAQNLLSGFINMPENVHFGFKLTGNDQHPDIKLTGVNTGGN